MSIKNHLPAQNFWPVFVHAQATAPSKDLQSKALKEAIGGNGM
jgi:hypothetical protein